MKKLIFIVSLTVFLHPELLLAQTTICGYVVNETDSSAMNDATVFIYDEYNLPLKEDLRRTTDRSGYYEFRNIESGRYSVNAWTYFTFRADTFAYIVQPGIFEIDSTFIALNSPCFYVNFFFMPEPDAKKYEEYRTKLKNHIDERIKSAQIKDSTSFYKVYESILGPENLLMSTLRFRIKSIDSLFIQSPSAYVRKKDW